MEFKWISSKSWVLANIYSNYAIVFVKRNKKKAISTTPFKEDQERFLGIDE